ncbi:MAG: endonuclease III [Dehalococcoidia bacterium]|nr:endonuclease III [Dehalococcoidia bacterium]
MAVRRKRVKAEDVMSYLGPLYGPVDWEPRYNPAEELVYTILSQHTSDINSERAFLNLMDTFKTLDNIADACVEDIEVAIRSGGLSNQKSVRIKEVLNIVRADVGSFDLSFLGEMPLEEAKSWLKSLPGVGPKTAAIILCFSLGMPAMPVDTHIYRVSQRLRLIGPKVSADKAHDILEPMVSEEDVFAFHVYLIRHGRQVCKAQRPRCDECALAWGCPSKGRVGNKTAKRRRAKRPAKAAR